MFYSECGWSRLGYNIYTLYPLRSAVGFSGTASVERPHALELMPMTVSPCFVMSLGVLWLLAIAANLLVDVSAQSDTNATCSGQFSWVNIPSQ